LGHSDLTPNQGIVKFYPLGQNSETPDFKLVEQVHILTSQGHPEFDEPTVTELTHQRNEKKHINELAYTSYFGLKGEGHDHEPLIKEGTGKRWGADHDGVLILGKTFWEIFGVDYSEDVRVVLQPKRPAKRPKVSRKPSANLLLRFED
jgi:hypothetical protein